jgi:pimeloyl-ACP methyl ester carboxylesterase
MTSTARRCLLLWVVAASLFPPAYPFSSFWNSFNFPINAGKRNIPKSCRILILPGFGNASEDYTFDGSLVDSLLKRGWDESQIEVMQVKRIDWLQVFWKGAFDLDFWLAVASPTKPAFAWYLQRIAERVQSLEEDESIILLGHSAGGWLARAAVGFGSQPDTPSGLSIDLNRILGIVCLGAPNLPPPPGVMDMTRGALRITNEQFPGAFHAPLLFYVTVIGNAVQGRKQERKSPFEPTTRDGFAYQSYEAVCGNGNTAGDGVVPLCAAHVDNAVQLDLPGVFHSINAPDQWYGADRVLDSWHDAVLEEVDRLARSRRTASTTATTTMKKSFAPFLQ